MVYFHSTTTSINNGKAMSDDPKYRGLTRLQTQVDVNGDRLGSKSTFIKNALRDRMRAIALDSKLEEEWNKPMNMPDLNPE